MAKVDLELKSFVEQEYYGWGRGGLLQRLVEEKTGLSRDLHRS